MNCVIFKFGACGGNVDISVKLIITVCDIKLIILHKIMSKENFIICMIVNGCVPGHKLRLVVSEAGLAVLGYSTMSTCSVECGLRQSLLCFSLSSPAPYTG